MSLVTITISGPHKSGKSTIAQLIADRLRVHRLEVVVEDPDGPSQVEQPVRDQADRLRVLEDLGVSVRIEQRHTRRRT